MSKIRFSELLLRLVEDDAFKAVRFYHDQPTAEARAMRYLRSVSVKAVYMSVPSSSKYPDRWVSLDVYSGYEAISDGGGRKLIGGNYLTLRLEEIL